MTEISEDGNYLVRVRAQVMSRDDSSGGWVPLGGGGLSNVSVRKRLRSQPGPGAPQPQEQSSKPKHDYLIFGKRISDNSVVLSCTIKKDFEYNKVMPTFHHWRTGDKKFGLTFQAAADARAFDKGVRTAVEDLLDGFADTSPTTLLPNYPKEVGDDDVFMTLDLPQEPKDSRSSSDSSTGEKGLEQMHKTTYIGREKPPLDPRQPTYEPQKGSENYPYVQLTAVHEYIYPSDESPRLTSHPQKPSYLGRRDPPSPPDDLKKSSSFPLSHIPLHHQQPYKKTATSPLEQLQRGGGRQRRCRHCNEPFSAETNQRGSCEYAPDPIAAAVNAVTCVSCVQCAMYHCAADAEGEFAQHPCDCTKDDACARRWLCLTFLAVFVPCLWLYPPLKLCHWCGVKCGACGGRHRDGDM